jgi:hypothetical protein
LYVLIVIGISCELDLCAKFIFLKKLFFSYKLKKKLDTVPELDFLIWPKYADLVRNWKNK